MQSVNLGSFTLLTKFMSMLITVFGDSFTIIVSKRCYNSSNIMNWSLTIRGIDLTISSTSDKIIIFYQFLCIAIRIAMLITFIYTWSRQDEIFFCTMIELAVPVYRTYFLIDIYNNTPENVITSNVFYRKIVNQNTWRPKRKPNKQKSLEVFFPNLKARRPKTPVLKV